MDSPDAKPPAPPNIVLVIGSLEGGGAQRQMSAMANYWADKGWRLTLATWSGAAVPDFYPLRPGIRRVWLDVDSPNDSLFAKLRSNLGRVFKLRRLLVTAKPDAVMSFIDVSNVITIVAASWLGLRVVVAERTNPLLNHGVTRYWRALRRFCYSWADQVVAQTRDAANWIDRQCGTNAIVIPNALRALPELSCGREELILAVGRLSQEKGFDLLIRAFARVGAEFAGWRLVLIGEGPQRGGLTDLRERLALTSRVELIGQVRDVEPWMARAALVVQPSRREGFPNAVLEAMAMGAAVISANCPSGPSELIQDGDNGRLVPVEDVEALAGVMAELMRSPAQRARLGREARKVRQRYEQRAIMAKWESCVVPAVVPKPWRFAAADSAGASENPDEP